ncbi:hypothetical protein PVAND_006689 [Polypedilum vanderplanki]|uniref:Secreted protein n=1 Tax=Polypedilum vanderplanki TaxID=319348 RepID=A0A9J6C4R2_POLVA|nr:hypothetical protein PVAND_006689 [Polypedilum vanderplanki]
MIKIVKKFDNLLLWLIIVTVTSQHMLVFSQSSCTTNSDDQQTPSEIVRENRETTDESVNKDCPLCNSSEMPMELAEKINEVSDIDIFIHDFVDTTNSLSNVSTIYSHPSSRSSM